MANWAPGFTLAEQETTIQWARDERIAHVYTADPRMARRLDRNLLAKKTETHLDDRGRITGVEFEIPVSLLRIRTSTSQGQPRTPAQQAAALRLASSSRSKGQRGHPGGGPGLS